jgi:hypothetical protein
LRVLWRFLTLERKSKVFFKNLVGNLSIKVLEEAVDKYNFTTTKQG